MKLKTNFVRPAQRMAIPVVAAIWGASIMLLIVAAKLAIDGMEMRNDLPKLQTRLARVGEQKSVASVVLPPERELGEMKNRVDKVNAAVQAKGAPVLALLADLEKQLPPGAWLVSFRHRAIEGEVQLVAAAGKSDPLSDFLQRLERDPLFDEVMLLREAQLGGNRAGVQYEIRLKVRI